MRRDSISNRLSQKQRLALEAHMSSERERKETSFAALPALCDTVSQTPGRDSSRGIYKSASRGKVYGYYAQTGARNFMFYTRIQRDLTATVKDHIILMQILERVHSAGPETLETNFPGTVKEAVALVLAAEDLAEETFLRGIRVSYSAQHWTGRNLYVYRDNLDSGLAAWARFESIKGPQLFKGSHPSTAYTPEVAQAQWTRARKLFLELQADAGKLDRSRVEQYLTALEAKRRDGVERTAALWHRQQQCKQRRQWQEKLQSTSVQTKMSKRFEKLVWSWDVAIAKEQRQEVRAAWRERKVREQLNKKRRWDGKEPMVEFERRTRQHMANKPGVA